MDRPRAPHAPSHTHTHKFTHLQISMRGRVRESRRWEDPPWRLRHCERSKCRRSRPSQWPQAPHHVRHLLLALALDAHHDCRIFVERKSRDGAGERGGKAVSFADVAATGAVDAGGLSRALRTQGAEPPADTASWQCHARSSRRTAQLVQRARARKARAHPSTLFWFCVRQWRLLLLLAGGTPPDPSRPAHPITHLRWRRQRPFCVLPVRGEGTRGNGPCEQGPKLAR